MFQWIVIALIVLVALILFLRKLVGMKTCDCSDCPGKCGCKLKKDREQKK